MQNRVWFMYMLLRHKKNIAKHSSKVLRWGCVSFSVSEPTNLLGFFSSYGSLISINTFMMSFVLRLTWSVQQDLLNTPSLIWPSRQKLCKFTNRPGSSNAIKPCFRSDLKTESIRSKWDQNNALVPIVNALSRVIHSASQSSEIPCCCFF